MSAKQLEAHSLRSLLLILFFLLAVPFNTQAAGDVEDFIPPISCGARWKIEGKPLLYDRNTLSDRIDGEAELYFPFGFDRMAAARYASDNNPGAGMDVEIYRMGSLLDAFGIYANYRQKDGRTLTVGAESNLSSSQLVLYQDRYFVHIQMTGADELNPDTLSECARAVTSRISGNNNRPPELSVLDRIKVVKGSERYLPQSLLGYDFLNKGIMADAEVEGTNLQVFLLLGTTAASASAVFDNYRSRLAREKTEPGGRNVAFLEGVDPLYGPVIVLKKGDCFAGVLKFSGRKGVRDLLESVCR